VVAALLQLGLCGCWFVATLVLAILARRRRGWRLAIAFALGPAAAAASKHLYWSPGGSSVANAGAALVFASVPLAIAVCPLRTRPVEMGTSIQSTR
jgi:hypothetical protein